MSVTEDLTKLISGSVKEKLEVIETLTQSRLLVLFGNVKEIPKGYEYMLSEVVIKRFNRIGNEGMQSYSQEGESITFPDSDFDEFLGEIEAFKRKDDDRYGPKKGGFTFT